MPTDWERRQLLEIERGLAADFTLRRRTLRRIGSIGWGGAMSALVFLACCAVLPAIRAWWVAVALATVSLCTLLLGARTRRRARRRSRLRA